MQTPNKHNDWFLEFKKSDEYKTFTQNPVAYFCAEYALDATLPTYAGGLGILAGDFIRETAMQGFPLIAVGMFYKEAQSILSKKQSSEEKKLKLVTDKNNEEIVVLFPLEERMVHIKAWEWEEDGAKVYLLDTDLEENDPIDRDITKQLYNDNRDLRLKQEIILGLGGFRMLARLGYHASVYHLNESHSAFLALELVRHEMEHQRIDFKQACEYAKKHLIFTNHTLVPEGQELFAIDRVSLFMEQYAEEMGVSGKRIAELGAQKENPNLLSMTTLSFKLSSKSSAVSTLHAVKAKKIWPEEVMESITNGIFIKRWDKVGNQSSKNIVECHLENKKNLLNLVKKETGQEWSEEDLIFVWARRMVEYKQPTLILDDTEKLLEIIKNSPVPIKIIFSGPTGENENENPFIFKIKQIIEEKLRTNAVFLPNYNTALAEVLVAGGDVWLNTPKVGFEACGTSGMKAGLNGVLALSTNDGWIYEVKPEDVGWVIGDSESGKDIYSLIEKEIIPTYTLHLKNQSNSLWTQKMERARSLILENFSTSRMLKEYIEKLYTPTLKQKHTHREG